MKEKDLPFTFGEIRHLATRFWSSLHPEDLTGDEMAMVRSHLTKNEYELFQKMSRADQRHSVNVAKKVIKLGGSDTKEIAAALMHDVGKIEATIAQRPIGTFLRTLATVLIYAGFRKGFVGVYAKHNEIGERMLREANSCELVCNWAKDHELKKSQWRIDETVGERLNRADK